MAQPPKAGASTRRVACASASVAACVAAPRRARRRLLLLARGEAAPPTPVPHQRPIVAPEPLPDTRHVRPAPRRPAPAGPSPSTSTAATWSMGGLGHRARRPGRRRHRPPRALRRRAAPASLDVRTNAEGRWVAIDVHGGRYRFRAWHTPDLAMASSDRAASSPPTPRSTWRSTVDRYDGADVTAGVDDADPEVGATATVTALATRQQVDGDGIITTAPASGRDALVTGVGPWALDRARPTAVIDDAGRVSWTLHLRGRRLGLGPDRGPGHRDHGRPPPASSPSSSSRRRSTSPSPTSTSAPRSPRPSTVPIPAGTYTVIDDPGTCVLTYEAWTGDGWDPARRTVTGTGVITIPDIARDLEALGTRRPAPTSARREARQAPPSLVGDPPDDGEDRRADGLLRRRRRARRAPPPGFWTLLNADLPGNLPEDTNPRIRSVPERGGRRRRQRDRRVPGLRADRAHPLPGHPPGGEGRRGRHRGPALLGAPGRRPRGPAPGRAGQLRARARSCRAARRSPSST